MVKTALKIIMKNQKKILMPNKRIMIENKNDQPQILYSLLTNLPFFFCNKAIHITASTKTKRK